MNWVQLADDTYRNVHRAEVPGGWLVMVAGSGPVFVPDPKHEWKCTPYGAFPMPNIKTKKVD